MVHPPLRKTECVFFFVVTIEISDPKTAAMVPRVRNCKPAFLFGNKNGDALVQKCNSEGRQCTYTTGDHPVYRLRCCDWTQRQPGNVCYNAKERGRQFNFAIYTTLGHLSHHADRPRKRYDLLQLAHVVRAVSKDGAKRTQGTSREPRRTNVYVPREAFRL